MPLPRDIPSYASLLESCSTTKNLRKLQQIHAQTIKFCISHHDFIRAKLISGYASCAQMAAANYIFSLSNRQSTFLYNTLIRGYASIREFHRSLSTFCQMLVAHKPIDCNTLPAVLRSIAGISALRLGRRVHVSVLVNGLANDAAHSNALITMYAKCGDFGLAHKVFDKMPERNLISWSAMMGGYAMHGKFTEVFELFSRMMDLGVLPDEATFTTILTTCSHGGFVDKGNEYFEMMEKGFRMRPTMEHYTCMVDMLGRAGRIKEAKELIEKMEVEPDEVLWRSLLVACKNHGEEGISVRGRHLNAAEIEHEVDAGLSLNIDTDQHLTTQYTVGNFLCSSSIAILFLPQSLELLVE
ncbi:hypothetical protein Nepgr_000253 [Nepenthes gracilis]|uniref:Pentatricopeptide repeat-containing protein n=1 Tax=Nepenthes gracilis TaxID=150966 RepID=A0AAD3RW42_NEPGR|nr:hypothetical protein Nepgr_000253 [Nepenthes gracilis]